MEKTFLEEDVLTDDEIELQVKGLGGSRRHNWRLEEGLASILTRQKTKLERRVPARYDIFRKESKPKESKQDHLWKKMC